MLELEVRQNRGSFEWWMALGGNLKSFSMLSWLRRLNNCNLTRRKCIYMYAPVHYLQLSKPVSKGEFSISQEHNIDLKNKKKSRKIT